VVRDQDIGHLLTVDRVAPFREQVEGVAPFGQ
jgi:hypothetical protein